MREQLELAGSTALVTGASSGIGRAVASRLRTAGLDVIALGRNSAALQVLAAETRSRPLVADIRDTDAIARQLAPSKVDILVNCAGILTTRALFHETDPGEIDAMVDVNLSAPLRLARLLIPEMVQARRGHLIFIGSSAGRWPHPNAAIYGASKAGLSMFCDSLRCDLLGTKVRVTEIAPGRVETQLYRSTLGESAKAELYQGYASIRPHDIAQLVFAAIAMPHHVDVSRMEVFPSDQAVGGARIVKAAGSS